MIATKIIAVVVLIAAVCNIAQAECDVDGIIYQEGHMDSDHPCIIYECLDSKVERYAIDCPVFDFGAVCKNGSAPKQLKPEDCCEDCEDGSIPEPLPQKREEVEDEEGEEKWADFTK